MSGVVEEEQDGGSSASPLGEFSSSSLSPVTESETTVTDPTESLIPSARLSDHSLFVEYQQARELIRQLTRDNNDDDDDPEQQKDATDAAAAKFAALHRLEEIWNRYLEFPSVLNPHVEEFVQALMAPVTTRLVQSFVLQSGNPTAGVEAPLSALYLLCKVHGRKSVARYMPVSVEFVEPVVYALQQQQEEEGQHWQVSFTLLVWLGILVLVPFGLDTIAETKEIDKDGLEHRIVQVLQHRLQDAGPTRTVAASCLATLLTRRDFAQEEWNAFVQTCLAHLTPTTRTTSNDATRLLGMLQTLAYRFKTATRKPDTAPISRLWHAVQGLAEQEFPAAHAPKTSTSSSMLLRKLLAKLMARMAQSQLPPPPSCTWRYQRGKRILLEMTHSTSLPSSSTTTRDSLSPSLANNAQDVDLQPIPVLVENAMEYLLRGMLDSSTIVRWSCAKGIGRITERLPHPVCAQDVVQAVLDRFPADASHYHWHGLLQTLAELARHGVLLPPFLPQVVPLVEQALQFDGLVVAAAGSGGTNNNNSSSGVGAQVRDAACYVAWAFARAYEPQVLRPYVPRLARALIVMSLFDRQVNCRRAASAAFQECVGRQGAENFPHGIEILTIADYYSLGNRTESFLVLSCRIARLSTEDLLHPMLQHLWTISLFHWDAVMRRLTSQAIYHLTLLDPMFSLEHGLPLLLPKCTDSRNLSVRHGAVLGVAEMTWALGRHLHSEPSPLTTTIAELVPTIEKQRLYRGRGGEIMRQASGRLIECLSLAKLPLTVKQQVRLLDTVDSCLRHPKEEIQQSAGAALASLMRVYFPVGANGAPSERLQKRVVDRYVETVQTEENVAATRGFCLALGKLPAKLLDPPPTHPAVLNFVLDCLAAAAHPNRKLGREGDAETRRNAIVSLVQVCETVGVESRSTTPSRGLTSAQIQKVWEALFASLEDYNTDHRGDVGSWSRMAAMKGMERFVNVVLVPPGAAPKGHWVPSILDRFEMLDRQVTSLVDSCIQTGTALSMNRFLPPPSPPPLVDVERLLGGLLKQLSEKLNAVRQVAGQCLERLLWQQRQHSYELLLGTLSFQGNWTNPAITFSRVMHVAATLDVYFEPIIAGMIISVGGLTESVTKHSTRALLDWVQNDATHHSVTKLTNTLLQLVDVHSKDGRVLNPLFCTLDKLFSHGLLDGILKSSSGFASRLATRLGREVEGCCDMDRLLAMSLVALDLLSAGDAQWVQKEMLPLVLQFLMHRYPRIRRHVGEGLYVKLLQVGPTLVATKKLQEEALELLLAVPWDATIVTIRPHYETLCRLLGTMDPESLAKQEEEK